MENLKEQLEKLVSEFGIDSVMNLLSDTQSDKVYIPKWYSQKDLENMGSEFDNEFGMREFNEYMFDPGLLDVIDGHMEEDYLSEWEEYKEDNK